jgi:hypothetical protein
MAIDEARIKVLEAQVAELRRQHKLVADWHNTLNSHWWMRLWWFLQGYRMHSLGTWYNAPWNKTNGDKYNGVLG